MLQRLCIEQFVIIDKLELELTFGLNVLTGETGAGKSIIMKALQIVLGERISTEVIRQGSDKAIVTAQFLAENEQIGQLLSDNGLPCEDDDILIMQREVGRNKKNSCRINNRLVSLSVYRQIAACMVNFHNQNEQQTLFASDKQLAILDCLGDRDFQDNKQQIADVYHKLIKLNQELRTIEKLNRQQAHQRELLQYQYKELTDADLKADEDEKLQREISLLTNAEKINKICEQIYILLSGGSDRSDSVNDLLKNADARIQELLRLDPRAEIWLEAMEDCMYRLEDIAGEIEAYRSGLEYDELRLETLQDRLQEINKLKQKYRVSEVAELLHQQQQAGLQLAAWQEKQKSKNHLLKQRLQVIDEYKRLAEIIHRQRIETAKNLQEQLLAELRQLDIKDADFRIELNKSTASVTGMDQVSFLISFNKGEELKPIEKVASGGEMSRFMLSVKAILTETEQYSTMVFDEIDSGVGGNALQTVIVKLQQLSRSKQVICITHAPQIAACAFNHIYVYKTKDAERITSRARILSKEERVSEIARMLDGNNITELSEQHARQMMGII